MAGGDGRLLQTVDSAVGPAILLRQIVTNSEPAYKTSEPVVEERTNVNECDLPTESLTSFATGYQVVRLVNTTRMLAENSNLAVESVLVDGETFLTSCDGTPVCFGVNDIMPVVLHRFLAFVTLISVSSAAIADSVTQNGVTQWQRQPEGWKGVETTDDTVTLTSDKWSYLVDSHDVSDCQLSATVVIKEPARQFGFFGDGWSAWPDPKFGDAGFDAALLLHGQRPSKPAAAPIESAYRIQISYKYQAVALVKFPEGGYVQVVPCPLKLNEPHKIQTSIRERQIVVRVDGVEKIRWHDKFLPLEKGLSGIGVSSLAKVNFSDVKLVQSSNDAVTPQPTATNFSVRKFLGDRLFVFDGNEPVLELHSEKDPSCFAKLKPGYKPQLTFDSHWGLENQGAFPEAASKWTEPKVSGGGKTVTVDWTARNVKDRFTTRSTMTVGFDPRREMYTYQIDSELEVLPGEPFHFRYGFDFEHHTPLDPFRWQYLIARRRSGELYHRPVYPIDPGPQFDLDMTSGTRVWYGRHMEEQHVAPSVEYLCSPSEMGDRKCHTAVCAAFYDTGVAFEQETAKPGTRIRVKYRYTGVPVAEAASLFEQSKIYSAPMLDPTHHYIFADEWPKLTFTKFEPLSKTWIYGRTPFITAHNSRPTYELAKDCGTGSGFAMKLGPASFGKANLPVGTSLTKGRWIVTVLVKSVNAHGPGGRIELEATKPKASEPFKKVVHFVGNGSFDWKRQGFAFDLSEDAGSLAIAFGNSGTGEMLVTDVEFQKSDDSTPLPDGVAAAPNSTPPAFGNAPAGAIADFRMQEGRGNFVLNYATGPLGHLDLANVDWVIDSGRHAIKFAENQTGRKDYRLDSNLARSYLGHTAYAGRDTLPVALTGFHGGGGPMKGLTLACWIKPAAEMGKSTHSGKGDILGFGARRFILGLQGQTAPYQLTTRINVNDSWTSEAKIAADQWSHVAMTAEPADGQWRVRLYLNGQSVSEGTTKKFPADSPIPPSLILGAEIFYLHDAYYRGLIGQTYVFDKALSAAEILNLAR